MTPVHVLVSQDPQEEQAYAEAFGGAIQLYRFSSNVEAFERLTSAQAPVDVIVVSPSQDTLFNLNGTQLAARLTGAPLCDSQYLQHMEIVVIGERALRHERVHPVSSLESAIRLVKYGEVETAPAPVADSRPPQAPVLELSPRAGAPTPSAGSPAGGFAASLISSIWDAPDPRRREQPAAQAAQMRRGGPAPAAPPQEQLRRSVQPAPSQAQPKRRQAAQGQRVQMPRGTARARQAAHGLIPGVQPLGTPTGGLFAHGGHATPVAISGGGPAAAEAPAPGLEPARPAVVPSRGAYRGPGPRTTHVAHDLVRAAGPVTIEPRASAPLPMPAAPTAVTPQYPPQLAAQVQQIVYPQQGHVADPLLGWSSQVQQQLAVQGPQAPMPMPAHPGAAMQVAGHGMPADPYAAGIAGMASGGQPDAAWPAQMVPAGQPAPEQGYGGVPHAAPVAPVQGGGGMLGGLNRMRERVREAERAPLVPNVSAGYAMPHAAAPAGTPASYGAVPQAQPYPSHDPYAVQGAHVPMAAAPQAGPPDGAARIFDAPDQLMQRAEAAGNVSFG